MMVSIMSKQLKNISQQRVYHRPVMLQECLEGLNIMPDKVYVDLTFGGGGHSRAILDKLSDKGILYGFDQDKDSLKNLIQDKRFIFIQDNFSSFGDNLRLYRQFRVDGILADLGVSSHQIDEPQRGFSTRFDSDLDMRMNQDDILKAKDIVNSYSEKDLRDIFRNYGELPNAYQIAKRLVENRITEIRTTMELKEILFPLAPKSIENKFFAMVFQALRIEVNNEMESLKKMLSQCGDMLSDGGRLVVMSYHSLEDRLVKNYMKTGNVEGKIEKDFYGNNLSPFNLINRKPILASKEEEDENPRSRSAKLRIAEKKLINNKKE